MKPKMKLLLGIVLLVVVLVAAALLYRNLSAQYADNLSDSGQPEQTQKEEPKIPAPNFKMQNAQGEEVQLSDYFGKPIVLNFWASWCPPCKDEMPAFETVWKDLGDEVHFLMVNATSGRETEKTARAFVDEVGLTLPIYFDRKDASGKIYNLYSMPTTIFIDKDGNAVTLVMRKISEEELRWGISQIYEAPVDQSASETPSEMQAESSIG